jgi:hypothetical protein
MWPEGTGRRTGHQGTPKNDINIEVKVKNKKGKVFPFALLITTP